MYKDGLFEELERFVEGLRGRELLETLNVTITYSTGEKDIFKASLKFWANMMIATKNRKKYLYYKSHLISLDHVVKMQYEESGSDKLESK